MKQNSSNRNRTPTRGRPTARGGTLVLLAVLLAGSCTLLDSERDLVVRFPALPDAWETLEGEMGVSVEIVFSDGSGWTRDYSYLDGAAVLRLPKGAGVAVLVRPTYRGLRLPPAGTAVPWLGDKNAATATWADGVTATVLRRLAVGGSGFEALNVPRLSREIRDRGGEDPWGIDIDRIVEKLAENAFRSTYIKEGEAALVEVSVPPGSWVALEPFPRADMALIHGPTTVELSVPRRGTRYADIRERRLLSIAFEATGGPTETPVVALRRF
jgi:hypothetical protein